MTKVVICTVNWNGEKDTKELLASLKKLDTSGLSVKTLVISNQKIPDFEVILKRTNRGSAGGYNDGAKAALKWGAKYILLLNNDILLKDPKLLKSLVQVAKSDPKIGAVSPKILFAPGFEFHKDRYKTSDRGQVIWYAGGHFDWQNVFSSHRGLDEVDTGKYDQIESTGFVSGSAMLISRAVFEKKIFWDEDLFAYLDDNDFQERVRRAGFTLWYDGRVSVYHKVSRTAGIGSSAPDYYIARNRLIFGLRYAPLRTKIALLREALRLIFSGRPAQKQGVIDFLLGKRGALDRPTAS